jgi:hypothetical protein
MRKTARPCGHAECSVSTSIDDVTLTFGRGELHESGYWEIPCLPCAQQYLKNDPGAVVWPSSEKDLS